MDFKDNQLNSKGIISMSVFSFLKVLQKKAEKYLMKTDNKAHIITQLLLLNFSDHFLVFQQFFEYLCVLPRWFLCISQSKFAIRL